MRLATEQEGRKIGELLANLKMELPCTDCGGRFPPTAMEFDHLRPKDKRFILARATHRGLEAVLAELKKCELVCANCHRVRTAARRALAVDESPDQGGYGPLFTA